MATSLLLCLCRTLLLDSCCCERWRNLIPYPCVSSFFILFVSFFPIGHSCKTFILRALCYNAAERVFKRHKAQTPNIWPCNLVCSRRCTVRCWFRYVGDLWFDKSWVPCWTVIWVVTLGVMIAWHAFEGRPIVRVFGYTFLSVVSFAQKLSQRIQPARLYADMNRFLGIRKSELFGEKPSVQIEIDWNLAHKQWSWMWEGP